MKKILFCLIFIIGCTQKSPVNPKGYQTENVILITLDGVRWEEVFHGADPNIINNAEMVNNIEEIKNVFWYDDANIRREALMPFLWGTIRLNGQIYGNKDRGSVMRLTNPYFFSYPGYNELLVGFNDDSVNSNAKELNPNTNVLEFMHEEDAFKGQVAAFASWDVFDWIINNERNHFTINSGAYPLKDSLLTQKQRWMNKFVSDMPYEGYGLGVRWDALTHEYAFEYLKYRKPRLLYIAYDETDEFAHQKKYGKYLQMIHRLDRYIGDIWKWIQSNDMYRNKTTIIITTDHGRGGYQDGQWGSHGQNVPNAEYVWTAIIGPDTPQMGEITYADTIATNQIAATITHLLGYDFKSNRKTGEVIGSMVRKKIN